MGALTYEERQVPGKRALALTAELLRRDALREQRQHTVDLLLAEGLFSSPEDRQYRREYIRAIDDELRSELRW